MKHSGITPDTITYSAAISACEKAGGNNSMTNALTLLKEMKESKITPNTITYNAATSACEKAGGVDTNALTLLKEMKGLGIKPDTITYSAAISACEKAGGNDGMTNAHTLLQRNERFWNYTQYH